jgi:Ca-activated chloride channel family protein
MNMNPLEQLQQMEAPTPDPAARLRAKRAAMAEFRRIHEVEERKPATSKWSWKSPWLGGFATASVLVVGVSLAWFTPEHNLQLPTDAPVAAAIEAAPVATYVAPENVASGSNRGQEPAFPQPKPATIVEVIAPQSVVSQPAPAALAAQQQGLVKSAEPAAAGAAPALGGQSEADRNAFFIGNTIANLRGIDPAFGTRTLTLVDGRRVVSSSQQTDVADKEELSEVMVTGTRIQQPGSTSANPITSITAEEMRQLGIVNSADALLQLVPQNISTYQSTTVGGNAPPAPPAAPGGARAGGAGAGGGIDSRRRAVSASNQADVVDLNIIPSNLLQRMDVVTGGASATYGSGASAGAVNLTLNQQRQQAEAAAPPATTGRFEQFEINPVKRVADEPVSTFSIDVDTASYSFARRILNQPNLRQGSTLPPMDAVRVEEMINYFDYSWPAPTSRNEPLRPTVTVSDSPWARGRKLVHIGIKGYELPARGKPDVNLVLLMDVSGSMAPADRLPLAKQSVALLLDSLKPTDTVAIAVYAGAAGTVLPPTPVRNRAVIQQALDRLQSGGATAGAQGIQLAYNLAQQGFRKDGINRILLATDGDFNVGIRDRNELKQLVERERGKGIYLSVLGFGQGNYRDEVAQTLAQNGNGVAAYIDTLQEARKVLVQEATSSLFTIASDVKIQVEFNPATVAEYRLIGYETRALAREDFNNDKVDAGDVGSGHKVTAIYEIAPVGSGAQLIDERRYGDARVEADTRGRGNEYGFLKIRYKLPGESESRLMQQAIRQDAGVPAAVRADVNFSTAVAGFAQLLRGGKYTGSLNYDEVVRKAETALGRDEYGYRAEFVQLARKARDVGMPTCINSVNIQSLTNLVSTYRQRVNQTLQSYNNEQHPEVLAARAGLASAEASLASEVARLSSQGVICPPGIAD